MTTQKQRDRAFQLNKDGLSSFEAWKIDSAIKAFSSAIEVMPENPEFRLNLARAYTRGGYYDQAMEAMGASNGRRLFGICIKPRQKWLQSTAAGRG